ncbi:3',5'-cyclic adenosine monophosphate phosphodiesterase CpdA [Alcaligenes pakistanensis]|uniref:3',5'-cyclic adenosine monophosphate phosphodiesterase CpdA n=1 Tax=Alcaligenes pakistanensis TaxID=1482717 RepID=A0A8H9IM53_9BURK|nr:phosphodiesterase [Alcaligenes pakistanensis]GHC54184.1 3',5'-cyclic adenosine monophosphate phosphodiesterase CpdA [Alcaligenes pakistanensis]
MLKTLLIQMTDPHIREEGRLAYGRLNTAPYLVRAIAHVLALPQKPDALVLTGDLTDFGRPQEYAHLRALLEPLAPIPVYLMPGNHDDREQLRLSFPKHRYLGQAGPICYSVDMGELRLIALDSAVAGASAGSLDEKQLDWLAAELDQQPDRPTIIALHHPPFQTLIGHMDKIGLLQGAERLEELVRRHSNVERVISGHLHRTIQVRFGGSIACTAPSVAHQVCLDLAPDAASAWTLEPPGYAVHALNAQGHIVTHTATVGEFEGPFAFHEPDGALID